MRYDQKVYLITEKPNDTDDLNFGGSQTATKVKANVKRANIKLGNGEVYDTTIVRVYGEYSADYVGFADYDPETKQGARKIQQIGRHFNRTDFYVVNSEVIFSAK